MGLSQTFDLFWRTIVAPTAAAYWRSRDTRCADADGRMRSVQYHRPRDVPSPDFKAVYRRAMGVSQSHLRTVDWAFICLVTVSLGLSLYAGVLSGRAPWAFRLTITLSPILLSVIYLIARLSPSIEYRITVDRVRDAWLAECRCPACGYHGLHPRAGTSIGQCSECGSAWVLPASPAK
jgi:hypothetical protein